MTELSNYYPNYLLGVLDLSDVRSPGNLFGTMKSWIWVAGWLFIPFGCLGWDYEGHRLIQQLALTVLPPAFPAYVQNPANRERILFLSGEADRWRNIPDHPFRHAHGPEHYFDVEDLATLGLDPRIVSPFRYDFAAEWTQARARRPEAFPMVPSDSDLDHTRTWPGFLPWAISEQASRLKSAFSYARAFEDSGGTSEENENARQNVVYLMGVLGHFVGDAAQPLHTTRHFNGWQGENPRGFTTNRTFHAWIDGGFLGRAGLKLEILQAQLRPARVVVGADGATNFFAAAMTWILEQHQQVLPLYELEKSGKFSAKNGSVEGREFLSRQLVGAAQMLGDIWFTAWTQAPKDLYLSGQLNLRRTREMPPAPGSK